MGGYSSWTVFALSHHIIVRIAALRAGLNPWTYENYMLLGDDLVIGNDQVAHHYSLILSQLGVSLSTTKSHRSKTTYEFAKRWIHQGQDVSGAPLSALLEAAHGNISSMCSFLTHIRESWGTPLDGIRAEMRAFYHPLPLRGKHLLASRVWEAMIIPKGSDTEEHRAWCYHKVYTDLCKSYLGCTVSQEQKE